MEKEEFVKERTRIISDMLDNPDRTGIYPTSKCFQEFDLLFERILTEERENEIFIEKVKEQLKGYHCGYHKKLDKMLDNRIKKLTKT